MIMNKRTTLPFFTRNSHRLILLALSLILVGCVTNETPNALNPQGYGAARLASLWWVMLALAGLTYLIVMGALGFALWRKRHRPPGDDGVQRDWLRGRGQHIVIGGGVLFPTVILFIVYGFTLNTLAAVNNRTAPEPLVIELIGHQWWWEVRYPQHDFVTANEIHMPVGVPVQFQLTSADVIHSFWVPELHGKLDLLPDNVNTLWLEADTADEYWGLCAEFCGLQHARMLLVLVAEPPEAFDAWIDAQQEPAAAPDNELTQQGQQLFLDKGCDDCHVVRGVAAAGGDLGPDLTHFASRLLLGAGTAPNNRGHLAGWLVDPHGLKPGNLMPATPLTGPELEALLAYMESLR